jgi:hypothetical protein
MGRHGVGRARRRRPRVDGLLKLVRRSLLVGRMVRSLEGRRTCCRHWQQEGREAAEGEQVQDVAAPIHA